MPRFNLNGIVDGIIANAIWQYGLSALLAALPFAPQMLQNMRNTIASHLETAIMIATTIISILLYCLTFALFRLLAAKRKCGELSKQLASANMPIAEAEAAKADVAAKSARLRGIILDRATVAYKTMTQREDEADRRKQEAAYASLSPTLRKAIDEICAKCFAEYSTRR